MKIALLGATGGTGGEVLTQGLAAGHSITALVRTPAKLVLKNPALTVIQGDATSPADLASAFDSAEVVISTIGNGGFFAQRHPTTFYSATTTAILQAMATAGVSRLLVVTSSGVEEDPAAPLFYRKLIRPQLAPTYADMAAAEAAVEASGGPGTGGDGGDGGGGVAWTLVRPSFLRDGPLKPYRVDDRTNPAGGWKINRSAVADFLLKEAAAGEWVFKHPAMAH
ncbi:hypothetical protein I4F81_008952 [Pyropia yezoensis]|uniref:Uncharacterized protein n=1 Tax=Pyropia yezoensis TaxID=2788 RepID=A0ACC3C8C1_PYRYE|nr:hypothetical protein I4F81_008952 [Neopyropia yezoensis]